MKLKSLLLGSATAVGLSTGAFAADLSTVVSSFDICEQIGVDYGIAMSKDCVQISGNVEYEFNWGDYNGVNNVAGPLVWDGVYRTSIENDFYAGAPAVAEVPGTYFDSTTGTVLPYTSATVLIAGDGVITPFTPAVAAIPGDTTMNNDWYSKVEWWVQFVGIASSDFGNASATIKLKTKEEYKTVNENTVTNVNSQAVLLNEAYVSVGDTTKLVAGRRDTSVFLNGDVDDEPFGMLAPWISDAVDKGVDVLKDQLALKGHVIQLYHALGDSGVTLLAGLEGINTPAVAGGVAASGTAVGSIRYAGDTFVGHASFAAGGILDGIVEDWKMHAAGTATFDNFKVRGAFAAGSANQGAYTEWNGLISAEATFDMFTLSGTIEGANDTFGPGLTQWGGNLTATAAVTDMVTVGAGFRWLDSDTTVANDTSYQAALQLVAKLTETLKATGEVGYIDIGSAIPVSQDTAYGKVELAWEPGGAFKSSIAGEVTGIGGYKATFKASKKFE